MNMHCMARLVRHCLAKRFKTIKENIHDLPPGPALSAKDVEISEIGWFFAKRLKLGLKIANECNRYYQPGIGDHSHSDYAESGWILGDLRNRAN